MPDINNPETRDEVRDALAKLDPSTDAHWTEDGSPVIEVLQAMLGPSINLTRDMIIEAAPEFTRLNPNVPVDDDNDAQTTEEVVTVAQALNDQERLVTIDLEIGKHEEQKGEITLALQTLNAERDILVRRIEKSNRKPTISVVKDFLAQQQRNKEQRVDDEREARAIVAARRAARSTIAPTAPRQTRG